MMTIHDDRSLLSRTAQPVIISNSHDSDTDAHRQLAADMSCQKLQIRICLCLARRSIRLAEVAQVSTGLMIPPCQEVKGREKANAIQLLLRRCARLSMCERTCETDVEDGQFGCLYLLAGARDIPIVTPSSSHRAGRCLLRDSPTALSVPLAGAMTILLRITCLAVSFVQGIISTDQIDTICPARTLS